MPRMTTTQSLAAFKQFIADNPAPAYRTLPIARARAYSIAIQVYWAEIYANPVFAGGPGGADPIATINNYIDNLPDGVVARIRNLLIDLIRTGQAEAYVVRNLARTEDARYDLNGRLLALVNDALPGRGTAAQNLTWPTPDGLLVFVPVRNSNSHGYRIDIPVRFNRPYGNPGDLVCQDSTGRTSNVLRIFDCRPPTEEELTRFVEAEIQGVAYENVQV